MYHTALGFADGCVEVILYLDDDDKTENEYISPEKCILGKRLQLGPAYQRLYEMSSSDIVMMCADDLVFKTPGWDTKVKEAMPNDLIGVVSFDDLGRINKKKEDGHPFIGRKLIELMGYICPPGLNHSCVDNWVVNIAKAVNRFDTIDAIIEHMHPKYGKAMLDQTYLDNDKITKAKDGKFFKHEGRPELRATIQRVKEYLDDQLVYRLG